MFETNIALAVLTVIPLLGYAQNKNTALTKAEQGLAQFGDEFEAALRRTDASAFEQYFASDWLYATREGQTGQPIEALAAAYGIA